MTGSTSKGAEFFTTKQLARRWQVSARTVMREIASGELIAHKINKSLRIALDDVLAYEAKRRRNRH